MTTYRDLEDELVSAVVGLECVQDRRELGSVELDWIAELQVSREAFESCVEALRSVVSGLKGDEPSTTAPMTCDNGN